MFTQIFNQVFVESIAEEKIHQHYWVGGISNGARGSLLEDLIKYRNAKSSPFNPDNYRQYDYHYVETIKEDDRNNIVLDIVPKPKAQKGYLRTKVFLDEKSPAIIRYNFRDAMSDR